MRFLDIFYYFIVKRGKRQEGKAFIYKKVNNTPVDAQKSDTIQDRFPLLNFLLTKLRKYDILIYTKI